VVIGKIPNWIDKKNLPSNTTSLGYMPDYKEVSKILADCDGMFNPSYKDAAPKTVAQVIAVGLPVLYADTGGAREIVRKMGIPVLDFEESPVLGVVPLSVGDMYFTLYTIENNWNKFTKKVYENDSWKDFNDMLNVYKEAINSVL